MTYDITVGGKTYKFNTQKEQEDFINQGYINHNRMYVGNNIALTSKPDNKPLLNPNKTYNVQLPEVEVTNGQTKIQNTGHNDPIISQIFQGNYFGKKFVPTEQNINHYLNLYKGDTFVEKGWGDEGRMDVAKVQGASALAALGLSYAAPWFLKNIAPYLSARSWVGTSKWLTPKVAAGIDATLMGVPTGLALNDLVQNGPNFNNISSLSLGALGLTAEAYPTLKYLKDGAQQIYKSLKTNSGYSRSDRFDAAKDLFNFATKGKYQSRFFINPETGEVVWSSKPPVGYMDYLEYTSNISKDPRNLKPVGFKYVSLPEGEIMYNPEIGATSFRARFPKVDGGADFGEAVVTAKADGTTSAMRLTSPRVDAESQIFDVNPPASFYEGLDNTVPKEVIKPFIPKLMSVNKPGAYLSGDVTLYPLGNKVLNTYSSDGIIPAIKTIFTETSPSYVDQMGLSPDSYAALIKWPNKSSNAVVRWGPGFTNWNPSAVKNKHVYDAFKRWESGEISFEDYEYIFNTWAKEIGGKPLQYTIIDDKKIPVHPHPFIHIKGSFKK